jgi:hypothetical protein
MSYTFEEICDATSLLAFDLFTSDAEVREFFTIHNLCCMYDFDIGVGQKVLDEMAEIVIAKQWHYKPTHYVAFDGEGCTVSESKESLGWDDVFDEVADALSKAGLPDIHGDERWRDFHEGCSFQGTKRECDAIKAVLEKLPVSIYEGNL